MANILTLLDGGFGHALKEKNVEELCEGLGYDELFAAGSLANILRPDVVKRVIQDYINSGSTVITVNNFGCTKWNLSKINKADQALHLAVAGARLAQEAAAARGVQIAASLPPLEESYQVHSSSECASMASEYTSLATALAPFVDLFLCETMASIEQAQTAANAAASIDFTKPIWISFTLEDSERAVLRSGEAAVDAVSAVAAVPGLQAVLFNCCAPQAVTAALKTVKNSNVLGPGVRLGGYANGFRSTTSEWLLSQTQSLPEKADLDEGGPSPSSPPLLELPGTEYDDDGIILPEAYLKHAEKWVEAGASIIGGCCGIGHQHIQLLHEKLIL